VGISIEFLGKHVTMGTILMELDVRLIVQIACQVTPVLEEQAPQMIYVHIHVETASLP